MGDLVCSDWTMEWQMELSSEDAVLSKLMQTLL
jgi:hypothetical protein